MGRASFRDIKQEMERRIASRVWKPGATIPGEEDLAREFGSARATVNRALQELARAGVVERKRKAGTRVALHRVREARFVIPLVRQEIEAGGAAYGYERLSRQVEPAPASVRERLALPARTRLLHLRCLHLAGGRPWQYEDRWINLAAAAGPDEAETLLVAEGQPVFVAERETWVGEQPVTFVRLVHPSSYVLKTSV